MAHLPPPSNETKIILDLLPPPPSLYQITNLIKSQLDKIKSKLLNKVREMLLSFVDGICPTQQQINKFITTRNNIIEQLTKIYNVVDRTSNTISGASNLLTTLLTTIKITSKAARGLVVGSIFSPFPIPGAVSSGISAAQGEVEKLKFSEKGEQKLVLTEGALITASIVTKLFVNVLRELILSIEALDASILECSIPFKENGEEPTQEEILKFKEEVQTKLIPIPNEVVNFVEQDIIEEERSLIDTAYRGFIFEIEEVPFSPTTNRRRALAKNQDNITLLQTELSFTSTPDILIQELKLIIDRDNLKAD